MTLSSFRAQPKRGHLDRIKKVIRYLLKMDREAIRICTEMPDNSDGVIERYDWSKTVYAGSEEEIPHDIPTLKGKPVRLVTYVMILILITTFLMVKLPRASCTLLIKHHLTGILRSKQQQKLLHSVQRNLQQGQQWSRAVPTDWLLCTLEYQLKGHLSCLEIMSLL